jgi:Kef-type K+ transport system membrane component KefB
MEHISFTGVAIVAAVAFAVPLVLGFLPWLRLPSVIVEILAGVVIGPSVLGWVTVDAPLHILSLVGLSALLFLSGLEIELEHLRGRRLELTGVAFLASLALSFATAFGLAAAGLVSAPTFVAIVLAATALGLVIPILKDAGQATSEYGQIVIAGASIADFVTVILLSLFFSREQSSVAAQLLLLAGFVVLAIVVVAVVSRVSRVGRLSAVLLRLQDTTAQIRVRGAVLLMVGLVAVAEHVGLEAILGAFMAGAMLTLVDKEQKVTHPQFRMKLEAIGFGVFVPMFFVTSGLRFNLDALLASPAAMAQVPLYLGALLLVRGLPALLYKAAIGPRHAVAAGFLQAMNLSFIVASVQIGRALEVIDEAVAAALMATALLSVLIFPLAASLVLPKGTRAGA